MTGLGQRRYEHPTFWSRTASILAWVYAVGPGLIAVLVIALIIAYLLIVVVFVIGPNSLGLDP